MRKGFTLIELLAVIVILAIIALIATPIIINIIENAREESEKRSIELYASAVKNAIASYQLTYKAVPTSIDDLTIEYDGDVECTTREIYEDGNIYLKDCTVNGSKVEGYTYGTRQGTSVVKLCTANTTKAQANVWQGSEDPGVIGSYAKEEVGLLASEDGSYTPGVAYTCNFIDENKSNDMTFFVLSESGDNVTLISGSNLGGTVAWSEDGSNHINDPEDQQAVTAKAALAERTENWTKLTTEQKAEIKLPTEAQIEGAYTGTMPKWLYSHTTNNVAQGYWTASPNADYSNFAWYVDYDGSLATYYVVDTDDFGVRPVITISKSSIN